MQFFIFLLSFLFFVPVESWAHDPDLTADQWLYSEHIHFSDTPGSIKPTKVMNLVAIGKNFDTTGSSGSDSERVIFINDAMMLKIAQILSSNDTDGDSSRLIFVNTNELIRWAQTFAAADTGGLRDTQLTMFLTTAMMQELGRFIASAETATPADSPTTIELDDTLINRLARAIAASETSLAPDSPTTVVFDDVFAISLAQKIAANDTPKSVTITNTPTILIGNAPESGVFIVPDTRGLGASAAFPLRVSVVNPSESSVVISEDTRGLGSSASKPLFVASDTKPGDTRLQRLIDITADSNGFVFGTDPTNLAIVRRMNLARANVTTSGGDPAGPVMLVKDGLGAATYTELIQHSDPMFGFKGFAALGAKQTGELFILPIVDIASAFNPAEFAVNVRMTKDDSGLATADLQRLIRLDLLSILNELARDTQLKTTLDSGTVDVVSTFGDSVTVRLSDTAFYISSDARGIGSSVSNPFFVSTDSKSPQVTPIESTFADSFTAKLSDTFFNEKYETTDTIFILSGNGALGEVDVETLSVGVTDILVSADVASFIKFSNNVTTANGFRLPSGAATLFKIDLVPGSTIAVTSASAFDVRIWARKR